MPKPNAYMVPTLFVDSDLDHFKNRKLYHCLPQFPIENSQNFQAKFTWSLYPLWHIQTYKRLQLLPARRPLYYLFSIIRKDFFSQKKKD